MQSRNPYAPPQAPLVAAEEPATFSTDAENFEYGGFWRRVGASVLDSLIEAPLVILLFVLFNYTRNAYLYYALPSVAFNLFFNIWLVRRFGGTPGKRILNMRIAMTDGSPVTVRAATLRFLPMLVLALLSLTAMIQTTYSLGPGFESLSYVGKLGEMGKLAPAWNNFVTGFMYIWWIASAITLAANRRKRTIHDFIAGTIVLRTD
jgi:uncharacterized RDD family membrane protein YckC